MISSQSKKSKSILLVFPTPLEKQAIITNEFQSYISESSVLKITSLVTGAGTPATILNLSIHLHSNSYDVIIQSGLCGIYHVTLPLGSVVNVESDYFGDLGIEDHEHFIPLHQTSFGKDEPHAYWANSYYSNLCTRIFPKVSGVTVNKSHGNKTSIDHFLQYNTADIESMEGAAFFKTCQAFDQKAVQLRAVSNRVESRNTDQWKTKESFQALSKALMQFFEEIKNTIEE